MKPFIVGLFLTATTTLNAQHMATPKALIVQLFNATDLNDWQTVESCFSTAVTLDYSSMNGIPASVLSPVEIISAWKNVLPGFSSTHHQLGNFQVELTSDTAHVFCYGTASHYLEHKDGNLWIVVGTYDFKLVKNDDDHWQIKKMKFNFKYQDGNLGLPQIAIDQIQTEK